MAGALPADNSECAVIPKFLRHVNTSRPCVDLEGANMFSVIDWLVQESQRCKSAEDFVAVLVSQIRASSHPARELEYTVGALRTALEVYLEGQGSGASGNRCRFCGKSRNDVRTLLVSAESTICDECIATALHTISHQRGQFHLRMAFFIFKVFASVGRFFTWR